MAIWVDDTRLDIFDDHTAPTYPANAMLANINVSSMRFNHPSFPHGHGHHPFMGHNHNGHLNRFPATAYHYNPSNRRANQLLYGHHNGIVTSNPSNQMTSSHQHQQQIIDQEDALVNGHHSGAGGRSGAGTGGGGGSVNVGMPGSHHGAGGDPLVQNIPTINRRCVRNRCFTCLLMVMLPVGVTSTLIWAFKVQKQVNHESAIIAFMVFCFAFVFPFVLFFAAVVGHKIYKIYLIIKRHEEMQREQINNRQAAAAAAAAGGTNELPAGDHYSESGSNLTIGRSSPGAGGQTVNLPPEEDPPPSYELAILCPPVDLIPKPKTDIHSSTACREVPSPKHGPPTSREGQEREEKAHGTANQQQQQQQSQTQEPPSSESTPDAVQEQESESQPASGAGNGTTTDDSRSPPTTTSGTEEPPPPYNEKLHRKK